VRQPAALHPEILIEAHAVDDQGIALHQPTE
jgi:hypothetical protein